MSANRTHSDNARWITPPWIPRALGVFDLDPCADTEQPWRHALVQWTKVENGLRHRWFGRVWLNPPYGRQTGTWLEQLAEHGNGIALVFARTETRMFHEHVWPKANALLFLKGRPHFCYPSGAEAKGKAGGPLVLIAYGRLNARQLRRSGLDGAYVRLR